MIVDDEESARRLAARLLTADGYRCLEAADAQAALAAVRAGAADAMLLDLILGPENGWEVLRRVREISPLPVLLVTGGDVGQEVLADARALGARGVLGKPYDGAQLLAAAATLWNVQDAP